MTVPPWRTRSSRTIYQNRWPRLREDLVELPGGRTTVDGVVSTGTCVGCCRSGTPTPWCWCASTATWPAAIPGRCRPAGSAPGEPITDAAQRELAEESGYRAGRLEPVCAYHTSKSVMDETAHLFLAFDLTRPRRAPKPDATESFQVRPYRFQEVLGMVDAGEIVDSMTIVAVLQAERRRAGTR
jgi:ADP-ribose diphosphatase